MLTIYRASAGAGKTYRLTGEYLKLLFSKADAYRHILAVTFTNKATDEMKSRIIVELSHLAAGRESGYVKTLMADYAMTEQQVREQARNVLVAILHDYAAFNISTIDRFFQQTMRAFTREIGLQGGFSIEMDQDLVLSESVDRLLADLERSENKDLLGWMLRFAEDKIESGGTWSLRRDMMELGKEVFKEKYKAHSEQVGKDIEDKQTLSDYKDALLKITRSVEQEAKRLGESGLQIMEKYGLSPADFKGGSRSSLFFFQKLTDRKMDPPTATFLNLVDNPDAFTTNKTSATVKAEIESALANGLMETVRGVVTLFSDLTAYHTAKEIIRYYYTLGILTDITREIAAWREEKNRMLIADTTELLSKVIDGSDIPFIYEKTGTKVEHYMIDEFQDTSEMQWTNFRPLIKESLAYRRANLIVGDVKQSIYRFRNSDWTLLDEKVSTEFNEEELGEETLKENWRSCRHIVEFNNALFTVAPLLLQAFYNQSLETSSLTVEEKEPYATRILSAYRKSRQEVPAKFRDKDGHVRIDFLVDEEEQPWREQALERLPETLGTLQANGYELRDIAILVRTNREGAQVAETLLTYKETHPDSEYLYEIISDDALFVSASPAVRFMIDALRLLTKPDDRTTERMAFISYDALKGDAALGKGLSDEKKTALLQLSRSSLYEITEGIFRLFEADFPANEQVFIQAFMDMVTEYAGKETADITTFLRWWEDTGSRKTIATPDTQNAIRILTIHKSKGLGFKAVILPFCEWKIDHDPLKSVILWCEPKTEPFDRLHLVPVKYGQVLTETFFADDYFRERLHAFIDNLNTLYVAFTRAKEELIVFAPRTSKVDAESGQVNSVDSIASLLWGCLRTDEMTEEADQEPLISLPDAFDWEGGTFQLGDWWQTRAKKEEAGVEEIPMAHLVSISPDDRLQLRLHPRGGAFENRSRKHGLLMHDLLSHIQSKADIPAALDGYLREGAVTAEESRDLLDRLSRLLEKEEVKDWFNGRYKVMNEVEILFGNGESRRPDRVMIDGERVLIVDYKFGIQQQKRHERQVKHYMQLVNQMGFSQVEGYLWYVELEIITRIVGQ